MIMIITIMIIIILIYIYILLYVYLYTYINGENTRDFMRFSAHVQFLGVNRYVSALQQGDLGPFGGASCPGQMKSEK